MGLVSFIKNLFTSKKGKLFVLKEALTYLCLKYFGKPVENRFKDIYDPCSNSDPRKVNLIPPIEEEDIEYRKSSNQQSADGLLVFGFNDQNQKLLARISTSGERARVWLQLQLNDEEIYRLPAEKSWKVPKTGPDCYAGAGLRIRCLAPMRKWRISYNGILRNVHSNQDCHVKFSFIWTASSMPFDARSDIPLEIQSNYIANQKWTTLWPSSEPFIQTIDSYEQSGHLFGTASVNGEETGSIFLIGGRTRSFEPDISESFITSIRDYFSYTKDGDYVHITEMQFANAIIPYRYGCIIHSNIMCFPMLKLSMENVDSDQFKGEFLTELRPIEFNITKFDKKINLAMADFSGQNISVQFGKLDMEEDQGDALIIESRSIGIMAASPSRPLKIAKQLNQLVLSLSEVGCKDVGQTGGKGASLAELHDISLKDNSFEVPKGIVVTISSYNEFCSHNKVENIIKETQLAETLFGTVQGNVQEVCQRTVSRIASQILPSQVEDKLFNKLKEIYKSDTDNVLFAVRSSGSGEDSEDMSTAGQNDTFLGVKGIKQIGEAVVKCWASQFSHTAVQYKRQNGQELNSPMAVVVQEMVSPDQAGVMFTCDPVTGDPRSITITANYGLGESVVSATAEPDTITVERDVEGQLQLKTVDIGAKSKMTVMSEHGGVTEQKVTSSESKLSCLPKDDAIKLAKIGHKLEECFGCPLDVEWAIKDRSIYMLQARPVTTYDRETDDEIEHESDGPIRCFKEYFSKGNVG